MPFYLLDTNLLIDLAGPRGSAPFFDRVLNEENVRLGTSILCVAEFMAGAGKRDGKFLLDWIETDELQVVYLDTVDDALRAGDMRRKRGCSLPDALILASALRAKAHLLTHDETLLKRCRDLLPVTDPI